MLHHIMGLERALPWLLTALACGYLAGSIPFGLIVARLFNLGDLRKIGSGNIGATNVLRTGTNVEALTTLLPDAAKRAGATGLASKGSRNRRWHAAPSRGSTRRSCSPNTG